MDIEKLTKSQIVLLTLLTSFVTSIATGIVTVSLMEQAPPVIAQTVNRVVERTVEKVVPQGQAAAASVVTETVIVRESDLIARAFDGVAPSVVRLFTNGRDENGKDIEIFLGLAVVADSSGTLIADGSIVDGAVVFVQRSDGTRATAVAAGRDQKTGIVRLRAATSTTVDGTAQSLAWKPAVFASVLPGIGETVLSIGGRSAPKLGHGIVTAHAGGDSQASPEAIETSIPADAFTIGSPLLNINGEVVGLATKDAKSVEGRFIASTLVLSYNNEAERKEDSTQSAQ